MIMSGLTEVLPTQRDSSPRLRLKAGTGLATRDEGPITGSEDAPQKEKEDDTGRKLGSSE